MTSRAISIDIGSGRYIIAPRSSVAPALLRYAIEKPDDELRHCLSDPVAMRYLRSLLLQVDLLLALDHLSDIEVISRISELARGSFARLVMIRAADPLGSPNTPRAVLDTYAKKVRPDLAITAEEARFLEAKDIRAVGVSVANYHADS